QDLLGERRCARDLEVAGVVGVVGDHEALVARVVVGADQRVLAGEVDEVELQHQLAGTEVRVEPAAGVGDDQAARAQLVHQLDGEHHVGGRVALVEVQAPLHRHHAAAGQAAQHQAPGVARRARGRHARDVGVAQRGLDLDLVGQGPEPGAQHQRQLGLEGGGAADGGDGLGEPASAGVGRGGLRGRNHTRPARAWREALNPLTNRSVDWRMPRNRVSVVLLLLLTVFPAFAQQVQGRLAEVRVEGTTNYADIVRTLITSRPGTAVESIDLEAERNRVYSLGTFESVTVQLQPSNAGPVLLVRVRENPRIGAIEFEGVETLASAALTEALRATNLLEPGRVLNTARAEEGQNT